MELSCIVARDNAKVLVQRIHVIVQYHLSCRRLKSLEEIYGFIEVISITTRDLREIAHTNTQILSLWWSPPNEEILLTLFEFLERKSWIIIGTLVWTRNTEILHQRLATHGALIFLFPIPQSTLNVFILLCPSFYISSKLSAWKQTHPHSYRCWNQLHSENQRNCL